jgi:hypothetical protein
LGKLAWGALSAVLATLVQSCSCADLVDEVQHNCLARIVAFNRSNANSYSITPE